ncbi:hypothetical protein LSM04_002822 [Trypanosoma melophagium]|uniref:uncharacterized protein n=1 Tax=Trypanosoma melophagium TaxID=715481 RepID=UPI00351A7628|nr:hypothetical protein LSM04_002822 [Trypanosoma melophagium]
MGPFAGLLGIMECPLHTLHCRIPFKKALGFSSPHTHGSVLIRCGWRSSWYGGRCSFSEKDNNIHKEDATGYEGCWPHKAADQQHDAHEDGAAAVDSWFPYGNEQHLKTVTVMGWLPLLESSSSFSCCFHFLLHTNSKPELATRRQTSINFTNENNFF